MARNREFDTEGVLDNATDLFWDKGFNGVSTQELVDRFGISKSSMYGAFGDKMKLFITVLKRYSLQATSNLENRLNESKDVKKEITSILNDISKRSLEICKGCFIVNTAIELAPHNERIAAITRDHRRRLEAAFTMAIRKGIERGEISDNKNPEAISRTICNIISGIQVDTKYIKEKKYFETIIITVGELLK